MMHLHRRYNVFARIDRLAEGTEAVRQGTMLAIAFYYFVLAVAVARFYGMEQVLAFPSTNYEPALPVFWTTAIPFEHLGIIMSSILLGGAFVAAMFPRHLFARLVAFVSIIQYHAFISSFGSRDHGWILIAAVAFFFMLLPLRRADSLSYEGRRKFLATFWAATAFILIAYFLAGAGKVHGSIERVVDGQPHAFSRDAAALHVATWANRTGIVGPLGPAVIEHPLIGWPAFVSILLLQLSSLVVLFFPILYRFAGPLLAASHVGIFLGMGIAFSESIFLLAILLFASPLALKVADTEKPAR